MTRQREKFIIGISGVTVDGDGVPVGSMGAGKDAIANFLELDHAGVRVAFADPLKRICMEIYEFAPEQLWGSVEKKNAPDKRYPRELHEIDSIMRGGVPVTRCRCCGLAPEDFVEFRKQRCYLTPRYAMILLGTEWGRQCYKDTWVNYTMRMAHRLLFESGILRSLFYNYSQENGVYTTNVPEGTPPRAVVIPDVRFKSEMEAIKGRGGKLVRVVRQALNAHVTPHPSEQELLTTPDSEFDYVIHNDGTLDQLQQHTARMMDVFSGKILPYDEAQKDVPPALRK